MSYVFCGGMHRSGSTVQFQIAADILESRKRGGRNPNAREIPDRKPNWLWVCKQHEGKSIRGYMKLYPTTVALYCYRDVRNVVVSFLRFVERRGGRLFSLPNVLDFDALMEQKFVERLLGNYKYWSQFPRCHISRYEDFVGDLVGEAKGIATHLNCDFEDDDAKELAERYSIESQRLVVTKLQEYAAKGMDKEATELHNFTRIHPGHIHDGVTDFHTELTLDQIARVEVIAGSWLEDRGYEI